MTRYAEGNVTGLRVMPGYEATIRAETLHEAMEWSTLNGEMHRDPHGNGDDIEDAVVKFVVDALS
jgi:hypothetical protein